MRFTIATATVATAAVVLVAAQFASARGEPPDAASPQPPTGLNAPSSSAKSTEELKRKVEEGGFKDVQVVPRMFVVLAKKPDGQGVSMIVDADTLQALQLGGDGPDQGDAGRQGPDGACKGPAGEAL
ncbi:hypothetical protein [Rhodoplanes sp. Z2-YC6860]|uniref:hypothetical protein n=1 Tax=Rhodoplanes sp. Z2-YC6860 TaxID=674703 RepID=UPI0012ED424A|nr:hypothetical protein [Rhodoplanes sp. Z2-YC6860]